jgi:hypothetical protein
MTSLPARLRHRSFLSAAQLSSQVQTAPPVNDNEMVIANEEVMHAALRYFAKFGLGAAREARREAERAFFDGDRARYDWWLGICRTLDRRMAAQARKNLDTAEASSSA